MNKTRTETKKAKEFAFSAVVISSLPILLNINSALATTSVVDDVTVTVPASCTMNSTVNSNHTATVEVGSYVDDIGETTFKVVCNDSEGFSVYAVGFTNDEFGNTTMKPSILADANAITTGTATSGDASNWAMKLTAITGDYAPTLETGFNAYHVVPAEYTKVASYSANTDSSSGSSFKSTYAAFVASAQPADTYTGKVKYTVVHPASEAAPVETISQLTYMQEFKDLTAEERTSVLNSMQYNTTYNLIDNRDNKTYQIARLKDDNIWMAQDLDLGRATLTTNLTSANTNLDPNITTITKSTFNSWIKSSGTTTYTSAELIRLAKSNTSNGRDTDSASGTPYGTLYNYCAASAGTICSAESENNDNATSDICPAGWRLPTGGSFGEFQALYDLTDYNSNAKIRTPIASGGAAFAIAGYFYGSTPRHQNAWGYYWSSTRSSGSTMHVMSLTTTGSAGAYPASANERIRGSAIRCVAKRPVHSITVSYGTGISDIKVDGKTVQDGETISLENNTYQIIATPSLGYGFSSWSTTAGQIDNTSAQVTIYTLNENTTISATASSYVSAEIQNIAPSNCTTTASRARDNRDNHVYTIQRLADGKCWMMENLDLGRTELTADLTSSNTNLTNTVTASTFNSWKKTTGSNTYTASEFISSEGGDYTAGTPYGTLYNYCAASAGTICANSNKNDATSDLCPAGWRLPTGGNSGEFQALYDLADYNTNAKMRAPIASGGAVFALAGSFSSSIPGGWNSSGQYWSSTRYNDYNTYVLRLNTSSVYPDDYYTRNGGFAIRCVSDI